MLAALVVARAVPVHQGPADVAAVAPLVVRARKEHVQERGQAVHAQARRPAHARVAEVGHQAVGARFRGREVRVQSGQKLRVLGSHAGDHVVDFTPSE